MIRVVLNIFYQELHNIICMPFNAIPLIMLDIMFKCDLHIRFIFYFGNQQVLVFSGISSHDK